MQSPELDADSKQFILDVPKERLDSAPGFDKDHWPSMADQRWGTEIHSFYGTQPYWEVRSRGGAPLRGTMWNESKWRLLGSLDCEGPPHLIEDCAL
ncbi:MAG: hypothetical protein ACHBNF_16615 [Chromatiales bacterium]